MNKKIYISGVGNISPQKTSDNSRFLDEPVTMEGNRLNCIDPNYKDFIPADQIRRMGRISRMGIAAAKIALEDAGCRMQDGGYKIPDAIITGTGLGCIEDTEKFLSSMILNKEEFLTPTSFIQSTHNTVSAQIALLLKCHNYNFTYVHRGISFESALLDTLLRIRSGQASNVLLGAADELTNNSFAIMQRFGFWKRKPVSSLDLLQDHSRGTIAGEGAAFFLVTDQQNENAYAEIRDVDTFLYPDHADAVRLHISDFLTANLLDAGDIDYVITGMNGDPASDEIYHEAVEGTFHTQGIGYFKHLCGEYHTSTAFALWLASLVMRHQHVPAVTSYRESVSKKFRNILIYNHYRNINHSLILVSKA